MSCKQMSQLKFTNVPEHFKTREMHQAVEKDSYYLGFVSDQCKTQKMFKRAVGRIRFEMKFYFFIALSQRKFVMKE